MINPQFKPNRFSIREGVPGIQIAFREILYPSSTEIASVVPQSGSGDDSPWYNRQIGSGMKNDMISKIAKPITIPAMQKPITDMIGKLPEKTIDDVKREMKEAIDRLSPQERLKLSIAKKKQGSLKDVIKKYV